MISVGIRRFDSGFGLGDMEETELEEGEAFSYHENDGYDESIDPDIALSYIDEKLQNVLGHFQKDFEGGVSAENLGAKFGGYGSFLPTYQRSPIDSHPRTPAKVQNYNSPRSPNSSQLEGVFHPSTVSSTTSQSVRPPVASTSATSLPAPKPPRSTEELAPRNESANRKSSKLSDQKTLKVRLKVGSDNLSTRRNAEIYSGLGLDVSPSSSLDESPSGSEGMVHEDAPNESPTSILKIMTSFAIHGNLLLSPLPDDLLHLTEKTKFMKDGRFMPVAKASENSRIPVISSDSTKGDRKMLGEKKIKPAVKSEFSAETNSGIKDVKKEAIIEDKKISSFDNFPVYPRKDGQHKDEKSFDSAKAESDVSKTREAIHGMKLPAGKESSSKRKSKGTHHIHGKESSRLGSSIPKSKKNPKIEPQDLKARKEIVKAREAYRDFFGELDEQDHQIDTLEIPSEDRLKERSSSKRTDRPSTSEANPKPVSNTAPHPTSGPNPDGLPLLGGTQFIQENWVGCDKCQQWRLLPLGTNPEDLPDKWTCSMLNWLPNMNRCSITEEETTKALLALYQVPTAENQNYVHNAGGFWSQSHQNYGSHDMPGGGKNSHGLEITNAPSKDCPDPNKKNLHTSFIKSSDKEKQKGTERYSDGGDTKSLKVKSKRDTDQDCFRASKKVKTESEHYADEDWKLDYGGANGKDMSRVFVKKTKEEADGSLDLGNYDNRMIAPKKRKVKGGHDLKIPEDRIGVFEEEFSENEYRTEKKARVSKSDGKESKLSQRSLDGNDYVKRDLGSALAATSSSSKISGSRKTKPTFPEVKGLPVESVSSSPRKLGEKYEDMRKSKSEVYADGSRLKKSGKGSSRSKDKSRREKHEDVKKSKSEVSGSVNGSQDVKPREGKNKFPEMSRFKSDENSKRDGVSGFGARDGPDAKADAVRSQDPLSIPKQNLQNRDVQRSSKRPEKNENSASGKGRAVPLPPSPLRRDSSTHAASSALQEAKDLKHRADRIKNTGLEMERTDLYFEAVLKFLRASSLLESSNSESGKHGEMIQAMQIYSSTAKLCDFCAHEYEKHKNVAFAALAYKCTEVAYMRVIYSSHSGASRDRHEVQMALQMVPPGESPSSSASDVDNLNNPSMADKQTVSKSAGSPQVAGNHIIAAKTRPNFLRILSFTQDVHLAMEASRKSRAAFAAANASFSDAKYKEGIASIRRALEFSFQDIEGFLRLVKLAMEAFNP